MDTTLEQRVGELLRSRKLKLGCAESCTGGLISHRVTNVAGSSDYFLGAIVSYSNSAKEYMLSVPTAILMAYGAVSDLTARHMARGAKAVLQADVTLAVTGIAGPGGGSAAKPVGTVCLAWAGPGVQLISRVRRFSGDRDAVRRQSVIAALEGALVQLTAP